MKEAMWGYMIVILGIFVTVVMVVIRDYQSTNDQDYYLLKEVTAAAMLDSVDYGYYREHNDVRIIEEKFVENFLRRFAETMNSTKTYQIEMFRVNEDPPLATIKVTTATGTVQVDQDESEIDFGVISLMSGILDMKYNNYVEYPNYSTNDEDPTSATYYSISYTRSTGTYNYSIELNTFPRGVNLARVKSVDIDMKVMESYSDFSNYVDIKDSGSQSMIGGNAALSVKNAQIDDYITHSLMAENFTPTGTVSCNSSTCVVNVSIKVKNFNNVLPTEDVELNDGTITRGLYYVPIRYTLTFNE